MTSQHAPQYILGICVSVELESGKDNAAFIGMHCVLYDMLICLKIMKLQKIKIEK